MRDHRMGGTGRSNVNQATLPTAEHLNGLPGLGPVRAVSVEREWDTYISHIARLRLTGDGPASLIVKTGQPSRNADPKWNGGRQEVAFYRDVAPSLPPGMVPHCHEAVWDETTRHWHLLLEDLSDTHAIATVWPLPPSTPQCEAIIDAWARFHAAWWNDDRLGRTIGELPDQAGADRYMRDLAERFGRFVDLLGDCLSHQRRQRFERLLAEGSRLLGHAHRDGNLTIVHRDAHVWNCFLPRDGGGDVRFFDWDSWRIGWASSDLAYMMATHWYPERRRSLERPLLDRYHAGLLAAGVRGYDRRALDEDYRWSVLFQITVPVWQASIDVPPVIWWPHLERTMAAFEDWECAALL